MVRWERLKWGVSVFHLKYRPKTFSELDLVDVSERLLKVSRAEETPSSFLFTGPKGAGKTSAARILAQAVNCLDPKKGEPCGVCDNCKEVLGGGSLDIMELDAASNRGIEDVRSIKDKAYLSPSRLKKKVFIVDEVHMLTKEAFNALLKLIEEPPKDTLFILCTTEEGKIPETVLSRLMRINFRKGTKEEVKRSLIKIIKGEELRMGDGVLEYLLERSDGSFRNAQKMLNEIYLQLGKEVNLHGVKNFFKLRQGSYGGEEIEDDLVKKKLKGILERLEEMAKEGVDLGAVRNDWLVFFQKRLLGFFDGDKTRGLGLEGTKRWLELLIEAGRKEREVSIEQLPLELAAVEFLGDDGSKQGDEIKLPEVVVDVTDKVESEEVGKEWHRVLAAVRPYNHSVEAFLRAARPRSVDGNVLVLEVFYPFHKDKLEEEKNRKIVEAGLSQVMGKSMVLECVLGKCKKEPLVAVSDQVVKGDMYDVAKEIFG